MIEDEAVTDFKVGDAVYTTKGCRIRGTGCVLIITETGKRWGNFPAVKCRKINGDVRLFLVKNLRRASLREKVSD